MRSKSLPDDVVLGILLRLPVKSLKRFKCVCRSWCSNFEEPDFMREHYLTNAVRGTNLRTLVKSVPHYDPLYYDPLRINAKSRVDFNFSLFSNRSLGERETINIPCLDSAVFPEIEMISECEGVILLRGSKVSDWTLLLNPATQELKTLPQSPVERPLTQFPVYNEHERPATRFICIDGLGLGYDCCTRDYKVVRFVVFDDGNGYYSRLVELYTLSSNSWRLITPSEYPSILPSRFSTYLKGCCHWLQSKWPTEEPKIIAFDMAEETFQDIGFPSFFDFSLCFLKGYPELRVFSNCLAVFANSREKMGSFEIWVMKEYGVVGSWTKQLVIGPISGVREPLGMWMTGEWFFKTNEGRLALFHPHTKAVKDLEIHQYPNVGDSGLQLFIFTESLFSLNGR